MLFGIHIRKYYKKYAVLFILGILFLIFVDWIQLYIPEFTGKIVDLVNAGVDEESKKTILEYCLWILLIAFGMFVGRMTWRFCILTAARKTDRDLRHEMFLKAEKLSLSYYHDNKVGTIMAWFTNDLETIEEAMGFGMTMLVDATFLLVFTLIKMINYSLALTLFSLVPIIFIIIWGALVEKYMTIKWDQRQQSFDDIYDFAQENFTGIRVIKAFVKENKEILAFSKVAKKNVSKEISFVKTSITFDVLIEIVIALVVASLLGFGGWFVYAFVTNDPVVLMGVEIILTPGELVTFIGLFDTLIWPLIALGQIVSMRARAGASLNRVSKYLDTPEDIKDDPDAIRLTDCKGKITFNNFTFTYPGDKDASLKEVTLTIEPGESVGVVGRIGCGKSTLVNSLLHLYNVDKDAIKIDDVDLMDINIHSLRDNVAIVPQDNFLFSDTVENNINFAHQDHGLEEAINAAKFSDVHDNIVEFTNGYQTVTGERGTTLSGGQKQRISLARAYAKNAPILILDDSVSAVDLKTEEKILHNLKEYRKGKTTIVVASRVSTVSHLDKIIVMQEGRVEAFDTPANLAKTSPTYQKMVFLQKLEKEVEGGDTPGKRYYEAKRGS
ncbi:MAG: ABC transporter ATP-binding protein [Erysipelotrichaceae bacterium]|nr:ABC transporter ATP-binding protein [Erysipelotrichaceae bacterium]